MAEPLPNPAPDSLPATPQWRPRLHFTPRSGWMNDPNGLVARDGVFHLCYQHYPSGLRWGPMHWGHASSTDLLHWTEHPIALAPDAQGGMAFSGSAVVDVDNRSGLGRDGVAPWVALYTRHDEAAAKAGAIDFQTQCLAYSLDEGLTWTQHPANPVLPNPGRRDCRDPKVAWHPALDAWVMVLAVGDHVRFYRSPDLLCWTETGRFGPVESLGTGPGGALWECPDLVPLALDGQRHWVLLVSVVNGAANGGSGTLYFVGDFDGTAFVTADTRPRWLDHGPDDYAGVTWHIARSTRPAADVDAVAEPAERALFIGWMSNWTYAQDLPTAPWRSAMTLPRELSLRRVGDTLHLVSRPAAEVALLGASRLHDHALPADGRLALDALAPAASTGLGLRFVASARAGFTLTLGSAAGDELVIGYDPAGAAYRIDRRRAGVSDFHAAFAAVATVPRRAEGDAAEVRVYFDAGTVELFADGGLSVLSALHFPRAAHDRLRLDLPGAAGPVSAFTAPVSTAPVPPG